MKNQLSTLCLVGLCTRLATAGVHTQPPCALPDGTKYKLCKTVTLGPAPAPVQLFWTLEEGTLRMAASFKTTETKGYLAVGFADKPGAMYPASAAVALFTKNNTSVKDYKLVSKNQKDDSGPGTLGLVDTSAALADGSMVIKFSRPSASLGSEGNSSKTNLIFAANSGAWGYHSLGRVAGAHRVSVANRRVHYSDVVLVSMLSPRGEG